MKLYVRTLTLGLALAACGDDPRTLPIDAPDSTPPDAAPLVDAPPPTPPFVVPPPFAVALSAAGPDQLQSATAAPGGMFYAAGFAAQTLTGPRLVTVVKYSAAGLDATFGVGGVVTTAVEFQGGADEIDITTQIDGKILVSATVASPSNPLDRDIAVIRLLDTGEPDALFGELGVATINLSDAFDNRGALVGSDAARAITADATGIYVHAAARGLGEVTPGNPRQDTDFTVIRLGDTGALDMTFGDQGQFRLDLGKSNAAPRGIQILPDGKLLVTGNANSPGIGTTQPVIYKLTALGQLDPTFADAGLFHATVLARQTEVSGFAIHGTTLVTAGFGRDAGTTTDYASLRFDLETGARDLTWGGAPNGAMVFDPSGAMLGSACRNAIALPGGKMLMIGSTGPDNLPAQDAVFAVLDANGKPDPSYGTGIHTFALGANGNDQLWGGAVSGDQISVVGYQGGGAAQTETTNDDAFGVVFTLR